MGMKDFKRKLKKIMSYFERHISATTCAKGLNLVVQIGMEFMFNYDV
jgi:hypothetical protein